MNNLFTNHHTNYDINYVIFKFSLHFSIILYSIIRWLYYVIYSSHLEISTLFGFWMKS